ncbi:MAG: fibrinogen-like YCDxxxxGGGW domain-containing protein [Myxococcales bacterium]|nr:fibrinogen-like YCDxxxxGGGW domain-containing protein [Myxococcales bacterium]
MPTLVSRTQTVEAILSGALTPAEAALQQGVSEAEVTQWLVQAQRASRAASARRRTRALGVAAVVAVGAIGFVARVALSQAACVQTLPSPLVTFCADFPARADEMNGNFQGLLTILNGRIGPTAGTVVTTNLEPAGPGATLNLQVTAGGTTRLGGPLQLANATTTACSAATAGSVRLNNGALEFCTAGVWSTVTSSPPSGATISCATILSQRPTAPSGVYSLSAGGYAFLAECDMTSAGGGWTMIQAHTTDRTVESLRVALDSATYLPAASVRALALAGSQVRFVDPVNGASATSNANSVAITQLRGLNVLNIFDASAWTFTGNLAASNFQATCASATPYPSMIHSSCNGAAAHIFPDTHMLRSAAATRERITVWVR